MRNAQASQAAPPTGEQWPRLSFWDHYRRRVFNLKVVNGGFLFRDIENLKTKCDHDHTFEHTY